MWGQRGRDTSERTKSVNCTANGKLAVICKSQPRFFAGPPLRNSETLGESIVSAIGGRARREAISAAELTSG
jgi:hypothetical protein